jgi:two-component sensor histidine kinase
LRWTDLGGPYVRPPERQGFGTQLMEAMVMNQLRGRITFDWRISGLVCEIAIRTV